MSQKQPNNQQVPGASLTSGAVAKDPAYFHHLEAMVADYRGIPADAGARASFDTIAVRGLGGLDGAVDAPTGAVSMPIHLSTTFAHPGFGDFTGYTYGRCGNPTRLELENTIAVLEGGRKAFALSSGMAAVQTIFGLLHPGDRVVMGDDLYGGTYRLAREVYSRYDIRFDAVDTSDITQLEAALAEPATLVFLETPTNPTMRVTDIATAAELAHNAGALLVVDNTLMTCVFQRPLDLGADIVLYSATKYLGGHNDVLAGIIVLKEDLLVETVFDLVMSTGAVLSPFDSWLLLRSLKTLSVRLERQAQTAAKVAAFLSQHPHVDDVLYIGSPDHPAKAITAQQNTGHGAMLSFHVDTPERAMQVLSQTKLVLFAESLGGAETLITYPFDQTHGAVPEDKRRELGIDERLLRLSVGLESAQDIIADLDQALA